MKTRNSEITRPRRLNLEVTETICELLEKEKISRKELADRLGKSKGFVSQLLNGGRNLTLRTVADILHVLGYKVTLTPYKEDKPKTRTQKQISCQTNQKRCLLRLFQRTGASSS